MSDQPVVLVTRKLPTAVEARLAKTYTVRWNAKDKLYTTDEIITLADGADALLITGQDRLTAELIAQLPASVRAIATFTVGYDHIDLAAARQRNIVVTHTPDVLTDAVADATLLLLLGAARRVHEGEHLIRTQTWTDPRPTELLGIQVTGKRLGIFGMGRIGQAVAQRARAFGMEIHYHNRHQLSPDREAGAIFHPTADALLQVSQFFSIHSPATPETQGFLNAQRIALLPDGAVVVNTSRGSVVVDEDLIAALRSGKIAAAGLDVYNHEPQIHPDYRSLPNTFLLPHIGSATVETRNQMGFMALDNLDAFFAGQTPPNVVHA